MIHEKPITQSGWTGAGYTTIDPETGAGGYMIDGGSNGGWLYLAAAGLAGLAKIVIGMFILSMLSIFLAGVGITLVVPMISLFTFILVVILAAVVGYLAYLYDSRNPDFEVNETVIDVLAFAPLRYTQVEKTQ